MIITFIGHSTICNRKKLFDLVMNTLSEKMEQDEVLFYCGGYGDFDNLCVKVCNIIKKNKTNCKVIFVTPYITESYQKKMELLVADGQYDLSVYPPLENVPLKFAISKRNEWMVNEADLIIAYVKYTFGGAYKSLEYARRKNKQIINIADKLDT